MSRRLLFGALTAAALFLMASVSQARWMNVTSGRFQTMDTYEGNQDAPQTLHRYVFASNDPVNRIDPSGHQDTISEVEVEVTEEEMEFESAQIDAALKQEAIKSIAKSVAQVTTATLAALALSGDEPTTDLRQVLNEYPQIYLHYSYLDQSLPLITLGLEVRNGKSPHVTRDVYASGHEATDKLGIVHLDRADDTVNAVYLVNVKQGLPIVGPTTVPPEGPPRPRSGGGEQYTLPSGSGGPGTVIGNIPLPP
jgi:hypothetical protein